MIPNDPNVGPASLQITVWDKQADEPPVVTMWWMVPFQRLQYDEVAFGGPWHLRKLEQALPVGDKIQVKCLWGYYLEGNAVCSWAKIVKMVKASITTFYIFLEEPLVDVYIYFESQGFVVACLSSPCSWCPFLFSCPCTSDSLSPPLCWSTGSTPAVHNSLSVHLN